jgi:hypothetical protein
LYRFYYNINKGNINQFINIFIAKYNRFPTLLECFNDLQLSYAKLIKCGGYYNIKSNMGYSNEEFTILYSLKHSVDCFKEYYEVSGIYKITNIKNGKVYIGKATNLWHRLTSGYIYALPYNKCHNKHLQRAWNKDGGENFSIEVVEICDIEKLTEREQFWIDETQCFKNKFGYNIMEKSDSHAGYKHTEESKRKIAEKSRMRKGWNHTKEVKEFLSSIKSIPVVQIDFYGNFIKEWKSATEAARALNGRETNIRNVIKKRSFSALGYIWVNKKEYEFGVFDFREYLKRDSSRRRVVQLDLNENYIKTFFSITEAKKETGANNIYTCCVGKQKSSGNFKWMFEEEYLKLNIKEVV